MNYDFNPDWVSPPGHSIKDILDEKGLTNSEVAEKLGLSIGRFDNLLIGGEVITDDMAQKLGEILGPNTQFWVNREKQYREGKVRLGL